MATKGADLKEIIMVERDLTNPSISPEFLHDKGYATQVVGEFSRLEASASSYKCPIILLDCEKNEELCLESIKNVIRISTLHTFPLIVIGPEVSGYEDVISKYYKTSVAIDLPSSNAEIFDAIRYIKQSYEATQSSLASGKIVLEEQGEESPADKKSGVDLHKFPNSYSGNDPKEVTSSLMDFLDGISSEQINFGGTEYSSHIDVDWLKDNQLFPKDPKSAKYSEEVFQRSGKWAGAHLSRSSYISSKIVELMDVSEELRESVRAASFLFAISFASDAQKLLRKQSGSQESETRIHLSDRVKDSAEYLINDLKMPEVSSIVSTLGQIISREDLILDNDIKIVSSALVASNLLDKTCHHSGYWDPRAAHNFLYSLKSGSVQEIHPFVLCSLTKFLAEAIESRTPTSIIPKKERKDPVLLAERARIKNMVVDNNEVKVPLSQLVPGMVLSRPIYSFYGAELISENVKIDSDLIWRIWQIASIVPINGPVIVKK